MTSTCLYRVELDRADGSTATEYRRRKRPTTAKGFDRQHNNVVNSVLEELRYYRIEGWKRVTVTRVSESELRP
jgi:hypothetical protein